MSALILLIIEDDQTSFDTIQRVSRLYDKNKVVLERAETFDQALEEIMKGPFDGIVVDLKLNTDTPDEFRGNEIITKLVKIQRAPVVVYSANHMNVSEDAKEKVFKVFDKDTDFEEVLNLFHFTRRSGLSDLMDNKGLFEELLSCIYWDVMPKRIDTWIEYAQSGKPTKNGLKRLILNHLIESIDDEDEDYFPDEVYLTILNPDILKPGQIMRKSSDHYLVMSPACDLVLRDGAIKTENVILCKIDTDLTSYYQKEVGDAGVKKQEKMITEFIKNNKGIYYHWLPETNMFEGGIVHFQHIGSASYDDLIANYSKTGIQLSNPFMKNVLNRFSNYYSRQGQPDFDWDLVASKETAKLQAE